MPIELPRSDIVTPPLVGPFTGKNAMSGLSKLARVVTEDTSCRTLTTNAGTLPTPEDTHRYRAESDIQRVCSETELENLEAGDI
jgi:hypothetical protein